MEKQLTKAEEQLMQVLWDLQEASVKEIIEQLKKLKTNFRIFGDEWSKLNRSIDSLRKDGDKVNVQIPVEFAKVALSSGKGFMKMDKLEEFDLDFRAIRPWGEKNHIAFGLAAKSNAFNFICIQNTITPTHFKTSFLY